MTYPCFNWAVFRFESTLGNQIPGPFLGCLTHRWRDSRTCPATQQLFRPVLEMSLQDFDHFARPPGSIPFPKVKEAPTAPTTAVLRFR